MFDTPFSIAVTVVMFIGFVMIAIATPPLVKANKELKARILARRKKSRLNDDWTQ